MDPEFDSDCTVHGVATWLAHAGHEVCDETGESTGEWCDGPLEMRAPATDPNLT